MEGKAHGEKAVLGGEFDVHFVRGFERKCRDKKTPTISEIPPPDRRRNANASWTVTMTET